MPSHSRRFKCFMSSPWQQIHHPRATRERAHLRQPGTLLAIPCAPTQSRLREGTPSNLCEARLRIGHLNGPARLTAVLVGATRPMTMTATSRNQADEALLAALNRLSTDGRANVCMRISLQGPLARTPRNGVGPTHTVQAAVQGRVVKDGV